MAVRAFRATLIGPPGAGKGTIAEQIVTTFKIHHISTGDILRKNVLDKTHLGKLVNVYLTLGSLVPDSIIHDCIMKEIKKSSTRFLLDGYPRTMNQAKNLSQHVQLDACIFLNVPFNVIIKRLNKRWTHLPSGRTYSDKFHKPKVRFKDDITGEQLVQREDDKPKAVIKRLEVYEVITKPVIAYYKKKNILFEFGDKKSDNLWPRVKELLEKKLK